MSRLIEAFVGSLVTGALTANYVLALLAGVVLFVAWEVHDYGIGGRKRDIWNDDDNDDDDDETHHIINTEWEDTDEQ